LKSVKYEQDVLVLVFGVSKAKLINKIYL